MSGGASLVHSDLIKGNLRVAKHCACFLSPFETNAAGFKLALCGMWRRFVADEGYLGHGDPYHPATCVRGSSNQGQGSGG